MKAALVDFQSSFYDRHWAYALIPVLRRHGADISWHNLASPQKVAGTDPDLILYNTFQNNIQEAIAFDAHIKQIHTCKSIIGGPGATFDNNVHAGTTIDAACVGEGEIALDDYLKSGMREGRNIIARDGKLNRMADLIDPDKQPFPERDLIYSADHVLKLSTFKAFISGRGCPYNCTYCCNHAYNKMFKDHGSIVRKKSEDYMIEEISIIQRRYPLKLVSFQDDTFIIDKKWIFEFCEKYRAKIGIPFVCNVRPNLVTEEIVAALKLGGCTVVSWSIESGNARVRNEVLCRNVSDEQMDNTISLLRKYKMTYRTASVIGVPSETREEVEETIEANIRAASSFSLANIFVPYPGLRLTQYAKDIGQLKDGEPLPRTYYEKSVLSFDPKHKKFLQKTSYLTALFAVAPWAYRSIFIRRLLYALPAILLRPCYEMGYLIACKKLYRIQLSPKLAFIMGLRYLRSVFQ